MCGSDHSLHNLPQQQQQQQQITNNCSQFKVSAFLTDGAAAHLSQNKVANQLTPRTHFNRGIKRNDDFPKCAMKMKNTTI